MFDFLKKKQQLEHTRAASLEERYRALIAKAAKAGNLADDDIRELGELANGLNVSADTVQHDISQMVEDEAIGDSTTALASAQRASDDANDALAKCRQETRRQISLIEDKRASETDKLRQTAEAADLQLKAAEKQQTRREELHKRRPFAYVKPRTKREIEAEGIRTEPARPAGEWPHKLGDDD